MTPGAGTARPVRGIVRGGVRGDAGQLRRCVGCSGDTSVAPTFGGGILRRCDGRRAVMDVGAPFMTPGAGTARPVRGVVRGVVRDVSGQLRCCDGLSGDTSVAPTFGGGILRRCDGYSRGDGRRGAIYDARCRARHDPSAALRAAVYAMFPANCGVATVIRATQVSPLRLAAAFRGVASVVRAVFPANCGVAAVFRATQVSPLRFGGGILRRCVGCSGDTCVAPTFWRRVWRSRCLPTR